MARQGRFRYGVASLGMVRTGRVRRGDVRQVEARLGMNKYDLYMHSAEWRRVSNAVITRDKACQHSGPHDGGLEAHHLTYANLYNEMEHLDDLIALCHSCHRKET